MTSLDLINKLNPSVEIIKMQHSKITECMDSINVDIADTQQSCTHVNGLFNQLEQLCHLHFIYEERLLEEVNYPSATKQKQLHDLFLTAIDQFKTENGQCHTSSYLADFIKLRLNFILNMNNETIMLCDFILNNSNAVTSH